MIQIQRYRELLLELSARVNKKTSAPIEGVKIAVNEAHLTKKLKDKEGIWLCANYPDADQTGHFDNHEDKNKILLFLVEKVPSGQCTDEDEILHYAKMQGVMQVLKEELLSPDYDCQELDVAGEMRIEWEYDIFGGYNGLSLGININDYD